MYLLRVADWMMKIFNQSASTRFIDADKAKLHCLLLLLESHPEDPHWQLFTVLLTMQIRNKTQLFESDMDR